MKKEKYIGPFKLYTKKPNDITCGALYTMEVKLPVDNEKQRTVRVYLPEGYDESQEYPVMYMSDGQNIVDKYTTAYGAWNIDVSEQKLIKEGIIPFIIVGIDCPKTNPVFRAREYSFDAIPIKYGFKKDINQCYGYSSKLLAYIVNELKPIVDEHFATMKDKKYTAFGGSSMGGIMAFNAMTSYPDVFGFCLSFSPAFHIYFKNDLKQYFESLNLNPADYGRFFFYVGSVGFEHMFVKPTIWAHNYLYKRGFNEKNLALLMDSTQAHCEAAWEKYFPEAIKFWLSE
ncbi:MAG: esterase family protein [Bacilli bacterium]|nr:esterase family protein [Bacilli bacterium]